MKWISARTWRPVSELTPVTLRTAGARIIATQHWSRACAIAHPIISSATMVGRATRRWGAKMASKFRHIMTTSAWTLTNARRIRTYALMDCVTIMKDLTTATATMAIIYPSTTRHAWTLTTVRARRARTDVSICRAPTSACAATVRFWWSMDIHAVSVITMDAHFFVSRVNLNNWLNRLCWPLRPE